MLRLCGQRPYENVVFCDPVGYYTSIALVLGARKVVTDSGGLQREAFFAQKKCVTVLPFVVIPETMVSGRNTLAAPQRDSIQEALSVEQHIDPEYQPFGDGHAGNRVVSSLLAFGG